MGETGRLERVESCSLATSTFRAWDGSAVAVRRSEKRRATSERIDRVCILIVDGLGFSGWKGLLLSCVSELKKLCER